MKKVVPVLVIIFCFNMQLFAQKKRRMIRKMMTLQNKTGW